MAAIALKRFRYIVGKCNENYSINDNLHAAVASDWLMATLHCRNQHAQLVLKKLITGQVALRQN
jgi:hypothetical protein